MLTLDKPVIDISLPFQIRVHYKEAGKTYFAARDGGFLICTEDIQITSMHPFYAVPRFFSWPQAIVDSYHRVLEDFVEVRRKDVQYYRDLSEKMNVLKRNESLMQWLFSSCRRLSQDAFDRKKAEVVVLLMFNKDFTYEENGWMCVDKEKSKPYNLCRVPQLCKVPEPELFEKLHVILKDVGHWKDRLEIFKSIIYENFKLGTAEERWYAYNVYCAYELLLKPIAITDTLLDCFKGIDFINYHL